MLMGEEAAKPLWRRLACAASEDVGLADPQAIVQVLTAWQLFERVGWPEGHLFIAQAVVYVATAPKTNSTHVGFMEAMRVAERTAQVEPPPNILNPITKLNAALGHGKGYRYDHDEPEAYAGQEFFPGPVLEGGRPTFYRPNERGFERELQKRIEYWARLRTERDDR
jgi:putative ATPase